VHPPAPPANMRQPIVLRSALMAEQGGYGWRGSYSGQRKAALWQAGGGKPAPSYGGSSYGGGGRTPRVQWRPKIWRRRDVRPDEGYWGARCGGRSARAVGAVAGERPFGSERADHRMGWGPPSAVAADMDGTLWDSFPA